MGIPEEVKALIEKAGDNPTFLKGFLYGASGTFAVFVAIFLFFGAYVFKDISFKDITAYISDVENNKKVIVDLNTQLENLKNENNKCKTDNNMLRINIDHLNEKYSYVNQIDKLVADYEHKFIDVTYYYQYINNYQAEQQYKLACNTYNAIKKQIVAYGLTDRYQYFLYKVFDNLNTPKSEK